MQHVMWVGELKHHSSQTNHNGCIVNAIKSFRISHVCSVLRSNREHPIIFELGGPGGRTSDWEVPRS